MGALPRSRITNSLFVVLTLPTPPAQPLLLRSRRRLLALRLRDRVRRRAVRPGRPGSIPRPAAGFDSQAHPPSTFPRPSRSAPAPCTSTARPRVSTRRFSPPPSSQACRSRSPACSRCRRRSARSRRAARASRARAARAAKRVAAARSVVANNYDRRRIRSSGLSRRTCAFVRDSRILKDRALGLYLRRALLPAPHAER